MTRRVLLVNPLNPKIENHFPHTGLASLAGTLKYNNHDVLVIDYALFPESPEIGHFISTFRPDVIGISVVTAVKHDADILIDRILNYSNDVPILVGGPHASLYSEDLEKDGRLDYIVRGEAEDIIVDLVEGAKEEDKPTTVKATLPHPKNLPHPDYTSYYNYKEIENYPILTSRGCPYNCSYCCVGFISSNKWRARNPEQCIEEIKNVKKILPKMKRVEVMDDNPTLSKRHIKNFLRLFLREEFNFKFALVNLRADRVDDELLRLLKYAGCDHLALGAEHGDSEVFNGINKKETHQDIIHAATKIKDFGIKLHCCFIIGLPYDSPEKIKESIKLAKKLKPHHCYWNMLIPYKGTKAREYFEGRGITINEIANPAIFSGTEETICIEPCAVTPEFTAEDQKKAYIMAMLETHCYPVKLLFKLIPYVRKYKLYKSFIIFVLGKTRYIKKWIVRKT